MNYLYIGLGGFFGAISRYQITKWVSQGWPGKMPYGTLAVNVLGSFIIGILLGLSLIRERESLKLFLATGFLGALTTFSTFSYETVGLISSGDTGKAGLNIVLNVIFSVSAAGLGLWLTRSL
ncbi:MAG: fluoride efflux transporter CrcB [bacterium]